MKTIDEMIAEIKNKENVSVGGSACYDFGDVVLVQYRQFKKFGIARPNEEAVAEFCNKKNAEGVRTPKHLEIARRSDEENDYCYVLQEKAKGVPLAEYPKTPQEKIILQQSMLDVPDEFFEKALQDLSQLLYAGVEPKTKNIFLDKDFKNGGFTFIDLLKAPEKEFEVSFDSLLVLKNYSNFLLSYEISEYEKNILPEDLEKSQELYKKLNLKRFRAFEKAFPTFEKYRRDFLRSHSPEILEYFSQNGVEFEDLTLNADEIKKFNKQVNEINSKCITDLESGKTNLHQIRLNTIRNELKGLGLNNAWYYHPDNHLKPADFDDYFYFTRASDSNLEKITKENFKTLIEQKYHSTQNPSEILTAVYNQIFMQKNVDKEM